MRAQRLLSILMQLQVNRRMTARELARKLEVSERTILRDMEALSSAGVPVVAGRGAGGGWSLLAEYETRLTGLSPEEIQSLLLARAPKLAADLGLQRASEDAWTKLQVALPPTARPQADFMRQCVLIDPRGWRNPAESAASLPILLDALWRQRQVRFVYEGVLHEPCERTVDPLGLVARGSTWYLIASRDSELRTYRVSRMRNAESLAQPAKRPPDFDIAAYWERSATEFRQKLPQYHAVFLAKPSVMQLVRYRGWRLEEESPHGTLLRIRIRFDAESEALQFALGLGADVEVVEPVELRAKVCDAASALLAAYNRTEATTDA
jgi:predicted DNA-binding transcriptional regulator YafY